MNIRLKLNHQNFDKEHIENFQYDGASTKYQTAENINGLTETSPIQVFLKLNEETLSLIVPYDTNYLFIEDGWLCSTNQTIEIQSDEKIKEVGDMSSNALCYIHADFPSVNKIVELEDESKNMLAVFAVARFDHHAYLIQSKILHL